MIKSRHSFYSVEEPEFVLYQHRTLALLSNQRNADAITTPDALLHQSAVTMKLTKSPVPLTAKRITANHHAHPWRRSNPIAAAKVPMPSSNSGAPEIRPIARNEDAAGLFNSHMRSNTGFGNTRESPTTTAMPVAKNKKAATTTTARGLAVAER